MADHACYGQSGVGLLGVGVVVATGEGRILEDGLAPDLVEADGLRSEARGGGVGDHRTYALRRALREGECLHAAHRAADDGRQPLDAQVIEQPQLHGHHVLDGHEREVPAVGLAGRRVGRTRTGRAAASAKHVAADDEERIGVDRFAGADERLPPAFASAGRAKALGRAEGSACIARPACHMRVAGQRVTNQDRVRAVGVELAKGLIGHLDAFEHRARGEPHRRIQHEELRLRRRRAHACGVHRLHLLECLLEIGEDVGDVLDADREAHEVRPDAGADKLVLG